MSDKMKNFIVRAITGVLFVAAVVTCFLRPEAMILLFALVTGLTIWEFTGIVNDMPACTCSSVSLAIARASFRRQCSSLTCLLSSICSSPNSTQRRLIR